MTAATAQSASVPNFPLNSTVYWRVRTKGVHADFGPWSGNSSFHVRQPPQLAFDAPGQTVRNVPVGVSVQYVDASGALAAMAVAITDTGGNVLYEEALGTSTATSVNKDEWMPEDGGEYRIVATARSTSGLQSTASMPFRVEFELPRRASLRIEADIERGYAELQCIVDNNDEGQDVESLSIWRGTRDGERLIASDLSDGSSVVDRYAPLNTEYSYRVAAYAASGASRATEHTGSI
ncbi:hypothetical protein L0P44_10965, partial [Streptococcus gordonii]|nr:hypothetical protein [Streptococcus gordonii]